jgi:hypothetical protein
MLGPAKNAGQIHGRAISPTAPSSNQVLKWNASTSKWEASDAPAAGSDTYVQYNNSGVLAGDAGMAYAQATKSLILGGAITINEGGYDQDTRIEGDNDANLFYVDASTDSIGVGIAVPLAFVHLKAGTTLRAPLLFPTGVNLTSPVAGAIEFDGTYLYFTQGALRRAIAISGGVGGWSEVTGVTQAIVAAVGYVANHATQRIVFTLPATMAIGQTIRLVGKGAAGWRIAQNAGQQVKFGMTNTTVGVDGFIESNYLTDAIEIICTTADTTFRVVSSVGVMEVG